MVNVPARPVAYPPCGALNLIDHAPGGEECWGHADTWQNVLKDPRRHTVRVAVGFPNVCGPLFRWINAWEPVTTAELL